MTHHPDVISLAQAIAAQHGGQMMLPIRRGLTVMGQSGSARAAQQRLARGTLPFPARRIGAGRQHYVDVVTLAGIILGEAAAVQTTTLEPRPRRRGPGRPRKTACAQPAGGVGHVD